MDGEQLRDGVDPDEAADYIARIFLSFALNQGTWDLTDPVALKALVRGRLLAPVLAPSE